MKHGAMLPWAKKPVGSDYTSAYDWLAVLCDSEIAERCVQRLRDTPVRWCPAATVLQAAGITPLPLHDRGVVRELRKALAGNARPPIMAVHLNDRLIVCA